MAKKGSVPPPDDNPPPKKEEEKSFLAKVFSIWTIITVGSCVLLILTMMLVKMILDKPPLSPEEIAKQQELMEILVYKKITSHQREDDMRLFNITIWINTLTMHEDHMLDILDSNRAVVEHTINKIIQESEADHFLEADHGTITNKILNSLREKFGDDDSGNPYVREVLIPTLMPIETGGQ